MYSNAPIFQIYTSEYVKPNKLRVMGIENNVPSKLSLQSNAKLNESKKKKRNPNKKQHKNWIKFKNIDWKYPHKYITIRPRYCARLSILKVSFEKKNGFSMMNFFFYVPQWHKAGKNSFLCKCLKNIKRFVKTRRNFSKRKSQGRRSMRYRNQTLLVWRIQWASVCRRERWNEFNFPTIQFNQIFNSSWNYLTARRLLLLAGWIADEQH